MTTAVLAFVVASLATCGLGFIVLRLLAGWKIVDHPNERSSHSRPTVRGGGIAFIVVILAADLGLMLQTKAQSFGGLFAAILLLAIISFIDDRRPLSPLCRLGFHMMAGWLLLLACSWPAPRAMISPAHGWSLPAVLGTGFLFIWLVGYTNAFNFMDGINGLAAGQAVITGLGMAGVVALSHGDLSQPTLLLCCVVAGASLGFLPYNFPNARMFMGDVGSAPLGFVLAGLALILAQENGWWLFIPLVLLHSNFILDTTITLLRRVARGERWYEAHRDHFYQRLIRAGKSHQFVTGFEVALQLVVVALMFLFTRVDLEGRIALIGAVPLLWLLFFGYCEAQFRRTHGSNVSGQCANLLKRPELFAKK